MQNEDDSDHRHQQVHTEQSDEATELGEYEQDNDLSRAMGEEYSEDLAVEELDFDSEEQFSHDSDEEELRHADSEEEEELVCEEKELGCDSEEEESIHETEQEDEIGADELSCLMEENKLLRRRLEVETFGFKMIEGKDEKTRFYTGLPAWTVFLHLFLFLAVPSTSAVTKLVPENELFLVLVRLRLGLLVEDLAIRFCVTKSLISRVFQKWLDIMYIHLSFLIA